MIGYQDWSNSTGFLFLAVFIQFIDFVLNADIRNVIHIPIILIENCLISTLFSKRWSKVKIWAVLCT